MESYPVGLEDVPASQIYLGKDVRKHGMLRKKSGGLKLFRNKYDLRYVIINKGWVYYYVDRTSLKPQGSFSLQDFSKNVVTAEEEEATMHHVFKLYSKKANERIWYFATKDEAEKKQWMEAFRDEIERYNVPSISNINRPSQTWPNKQQTRFPYPDDTDTRSRSVNKATPMPNPLSPHLPLSYSNTTMESGIGSSTMSLSPSNPDETYETLDEGPQPSIPEEPATPRESPSPRFSPHAYTARPLPPQPQLNKPSDLPAMPPPEPPRPVKPSHLSPLPTMPPFSLQPRKEQWGISSSGSNKPRPSPVGHHHFQFDQGEYDNPATSAEDEDLYEPTMANYDDVDPGSYESLPRRSPPPPPTQSVQSFTMPTSSPQLESNSGGGVETMKPASSPKTYNFNQPGVASGPQWKLDSPSLPPTPVRPFAPPTLPLGPKPKYPASSPKSYNFNQPGGASGPQLKPDSPPPLPPDSEQAFELKAPPTYPPQLGPKPDIEKTHPASSPNFNQSGGATGPQWKRDDPPTEPARTLNLKAPPALPPKFGPKPDRAQKTYPGSNLKNFGQPGAENGNSSNDKSDIPLWKQELIKRKANKPKQADASSAGGNVSNPDGANPPWCKRNSGVNEQGGHSPHFGASDSGNNPVDESRNTNTTEWAESKSQDSNLTDPVKTDPPWVKEKRSRPKVTVDINTHNGVRGNSQSTNDATKDSNSMHPNKLNANETSGRSSAMNSAVSSPPWKGEIARRRGGKVVVHTTNSEVNSNNGEASCAQREETKPTDAFSKKNAFKKHPAGDVKSKPTLAGKPALSPHVGDTMGKPTLPGKPALASLAGDTKSKPTFTGKPGLTHKPTAAPKPAISQKPKPTGGPPLALKSGVKQKVVDSNQHSATGVGSVAELRNRFNNR